MKINEIVVEAVNTSTGTPVADPERGWDQDTYTGQVDPNTVQMPDFSGLKQAAQGAKMLGKGVANLPGAVKGAVQGYQASQQQRAGREEIQQLVKPWIQRWNMTIGQNPEMANDPAALQDFASRMTKGKVPNLPAPADTRTGTVEKYLSDAVGKYLYAVDTPVVTSTNKNTNQAQPASQSTTPTEPGAPAVQEPAQSSILGPDGKPMSAASTQSNTPAAHDPQQPNHDVVKDAQIVQQDPIIIKYKNKEYGLNDNGQWVHFGSTKVPHQSFQAFLDKQAGFAAQQMEESIDIGQVLWDKMKRKQ